MMSKEASPSTEMTGHVSAQPMNPPLPEPTGGEQDTRREGVGLFQRIHLPIDGEEGGKNNQKTVTPDCVPVYCDFISSISLASSWLL